MAPCAGRADRSCRCGVGVSLRPSDLPMSRRGRGGHPSIDRRRGVHGRRRECALRGRRCLRIVPTRNRSLAGGATDLSDMKAPGPYLGPCVHSARSDPWPLYTARSVLVIAVPRTIREPCRHPAFATARLEACPFFVESSRGIGTRKAFMLAALKIPSIIQCNMHP